MYLSHDYHDIGPMRPDELATITVPQGRELVYIETPGTVPGTPYTFDITHFPSLDQRHPGICISTEKRQDFLKHGDEAAAQTMLRGLTTAIHTLTGGAIGIHPFYGGIYNDILRPVADVFKRGRGDIILGDDNLSMRIELVANGGVFSDTISEDAAEIPLTFTTDGPYLQRFIANQTLARRTNPNQPAKDQATNNGLGKKWQAEFNRYNTAEILAREPMQITPGSVALLTSTLQDKGVFTAASATVRTRSPVQ